MIGRPSPAIQQVRCRVDHAAATDRAGCAWRPGRGCRWSNCSALPYRLSIHRARSCGCSSAKNARFWRRIQVNDSRGDPSRELSESHGRALGIVVDQLRLAWLPLAHAVEARSIATGHRRIAM